MPKCKNTLCMTKETWWLMYNGSLKTTRLSQFERWAMAALRYVPSDQVYTVPNPHGHHIDFGQFAVLFTLTTLSMISFCTILQYYHKPKSYSRFKLSNLISDHAVSVLCKRGLVEIKCFRTTSKIISMNHVPI